MQSKRDMSENRTKELSKNILLFTLSNIGAKFISFLLVPLYTSYLGTEEYGIIDLAATILNLTIPVLTISLEATMLRFCLDKEEKNCSVITNGVFVWTRAVILNFVVIMALWKFGVFRGAEYMLVYYGIYFIIQSLNEVSNSIYRGIDRVSVGVICSLLYSLLLGGFNILFIAVLKYGILGYYLSLTLSSIICLTVGAFRIHVNKYLSRNNFDKCLLKRMQSYGGPLIFNQIGWWLNNSVDKYVVIFFLGMSANGVYSIAYRIPTIISVFSSIFASAWSISAIKEYKSKGASAFSSQMYSIYNGFLVVTCGVLLIFNIPLAKLLFKNEFFEAWKITGILVVATLFNGLAGFVGAFFSAAKDSKSYAISTILGGVVNIVVSALLVNVIGIYGVAIGTFVSYIAIWIIRLIRSRGYISLKFSKVKHVTMYVLLVAECVVGLQGINVYIIIVQISILMVLIAMNYQQLKVVCNSALNKFLKKK